MVHHWLAFGNRAMGGRLCSWDHQDGEMDGDLGSNAWVADGVLATRNADEDHIRG